MNALVTTQSTNAEVYRASTDAAGLCRDIVMKTAMTIQGRKYVKVEGWQAIAVAHGCVASAEDVRRINDDGMSGFSAMGVIRRMSDGAEIARAEGFLGDDETMWAKRPVYARRAMVQTRAISRACRSAFAHVVVLIDANLSTTPAEEVPSDGFDEDDRGPVNITPLKRAVTTPSKPTTLAERAGKLEAALKSAARDGPHAIEKAWALGSALCAELDTADPERLAELTAAYDDLLATADEVFA